MKKIILFYLVGLSVALYGTCDIFAQVQWIPENIKIRVPVMVTYNNRSNDPKNSYDSTFNNAYEIYFGVGDSLVDYTQNGENISITYVNYCTPGHGSQIITFVADTTKKVLSNFHITYQDSYCTRAAWYADQTDYDVFFTSLHYTLKNGNTVNISDQGVSCRNNIVDAKFSYYRMNPGSERLTEIYEIANTDSLILQDTANYECVVTFALREIPSAILESVINIKSLNVSCSLRDNIIHFSFPSSTISQALEIYDILGREVKRIEIPSGVSEYRLQRDGFMSGYYFARLGNMNAKFVVN